MSNMDEERFLVQARVEGLQQFERDIATLRSSLSGVYDQIRQAVSTDLGAVAISQLREQAQAIKRDLSSLNRQDARATYQGLLRQYNNAAPGEEREKLVPKVAAAARAQEKADADFMTATAALGTTRKARIKAETDASIAEEKAMLEAAAAARKTAAATIANGEKISQANAKLIAEIEKEANSRSAAQRKVDAAKEKEARAAEAKAKADAADAEKRSSQALSQGRVDDLTRLGYQSPDTSSLGRLAVRGATQEAALAKVDADLNTAKAEALTGVRTQAESERLLGDLSIRRIRAAQALAQTQDLLLAATKKEADAEAAAAVSQGQGPLARARSSFLIGFKGGADVPYLQQAGQAAKFSVLYGSAYKALFAVTQTFQASVQEGIAFQQGLSDMAIATGRPKEELGDLSERLANIATDAGASPSQGLEIGARSQGLYGLAGSNDSAQQNYVAELSARIVSRMAMGNAKVDPVTLQQNIAAVTQAMGLGAGGQIRVADLDAYFSKRFGTASGDTLEAAAQSSSVGISAGFSLEEIQAMAALMISRTGQSSNAVGGYLAQIFSRGGEGSLTNVAGKYGVDTRQDLAGQFRDLSKVYNASDPQAQSEISAAFGRGKVQNAVVAALQSWGEVATEARKAQAGAADGALDNQFRERISNIGGQLNQLTGDLKEFAHLFGESGLLAVLGVGIKTLDLTVEALNSILSIYNDLNPALREFIAIVLTGVAVGKFTNAGGLVRGAIGGQLPIGVARRAGLVEGAVENLPGTVLNAKGEATAVQVGSRGIAAAGRAALATVGPWAAAGAGLLAIATVANAIKENKALREASITALDQTPGAAASPTELRNYASQLRSQAAQEGEAGNWFTQAISLGHGNDSAERRRKLLEAEAKRALSQASEANNIDPRRASVITGFDSDSLSSGLDRITATGGTATQRLHALTEAIDGLGKSAEKQGGRKFIDPNAIAGDVSKAARDLDGLNFYVDPNSAVSWVNTKKLKGYKPEDSFKSKAREQLAEALDPSTLQDRLDEQLTKRGVTSYDQLTPQLTKDIAESIGKLPKDLQGWSGLQDFVDKQIADAITASRSAIDQAKQGPEVLSNADATSTLTQLQTEFASKMDSRAQVDYAGRIADARRWLQQIRVTRRNSQDPDLPIFQQQIDAARTQVAQSQIDRLEALRKVAVQNARTQGQASRAGMGFVRQEINAAVRSRNADLLAQVLAGAGKGAVAIARKVINDAQKVAKTGYEVENYFRFAQSQFGSAAGAIDGLIAGLKSGEAQQPMASTLGELLDPSKIPTGKKRKKKGSADNKALQALEDSLDFATYDPGADDIADPKDSPAQIRAARIAAQASRKGGDIAQAHAAIAQASADLQDAKKGTVAYYNALGQMYEARQQLTDALAAYRRNIRSLRIDATDPVAQARLDLSEARRQLRRDSGKGRDVRAEDRVAVRDSQNRLEAEKFNQRLSDVQTADQLGRISHAAYLRYLQNEHNRLTAIGKRTRQQQDELNQIDLLMKEAAKSMEGAWNIGDIKLPTPYEVRKYVKEQSGLGASDKRVTSQTTQVYIDGADVGMVKRVISETVGKNAQVMTVSPRRI